MALFAGALAGTRGAAASGTSPVPQDDKYTVAVDGVLNVQAPGVLANDLDNEGDRLQVSDLGAVSNGTVSLSSNGAFVFTPTKGFSGLAFFQYKVNDGTSDSFNYATAFINVVSNGPANAAPVAQNDAYATKKNQRLIVDAPGVLRNDTDANNDKLSTILVGKPAHGTLILKLSGGFVYTPQPGFVGTDSFTYKASDGAASSNVATVTITVK